MGNSGYSNDHSPSTEPGPLRVNGPTFEEFVASGYAPQNYPPAGYAEQPSPGLTAYRANGPRTQAPTDPDKQPLVDEYGNVVTAPVSQPLVNDFGMVSDPPVDRSVDAVDVNQAVVGADVVQGDRKHRKHR